MENNNNNNNDNNILSQTPFTKCPFCGSTHLEGSSTPEGYFISCADCHEIIDESLSDSAVDILFGSNEDYSSIVDNPNEDELVQEYYETHIDPLNEDYDDGGDCTDCKL